MERGGRPSRNALGTALIVLAAICFGTLGPLSRYAEEAGVGSLALVAWRAGLGAAVMALFVGVGAAVGRHAAVPLAEIPNRDRAFLLAAAAANAILNFSVFTA